MNNEINDTTYMVAEGYEKPLSVKDWIITLLLQSIPIVGIILLFIWAFGDGTHKSKSNYAKAMLIFMLIGFVLGFLFFASFMILGICLGGVSNCRS